MFLNGAARLLSTIRPGKGGRMVEKDPWQRGSMVHTSDEELFLRYSEGDMASFEALYRRHRSELFAYILSIVGNAHDAEEILQDLFAALVLPRSAAGIPGNFRSYIYHAARNRAIDRIRRRNAAGRAREELKERLLVLDRKNGFQEAGRKEEEEAVNRLLRELSSEEREVILLKVFGGFTFREIAELTNSPPGTVGSRYRAAGRRLREKIGVWLDGS